MGKQNKHLVSKQKPKKKNKKPTKMTKPNSSDQQQVDDIMAWGRKKQNYYRQDQDQYSSLSQQQRQAKDIYQNHYNEYLNDQDVYDIPKQKQPLINEQKLQKKSQNANKSQKSGNNKINKLQQEFFQQQEQQQGLPQEYITQQLEWILQLFKDLQFYSQQDNLYLIYEKLLKSYLTAIISIKQLKIPYIQYHPIIQLAVNIKTKITKLMKKLSIKQDQVPQKNKKSNKKNVQISQDQQNFNQQDQQQFDEQEDEQKDNWDNSQQQNSQQIVNIKSKQSTNKNNKSHSSYPTTDNCYQAGKLQQSQHKKGLQFYNKLKKQQEQQKQEKKKQKKLERQENKKPTFKQIKQNQGRFASQLILKNKGLIKKRKKIQGNSRVKLRKKYQKKKAIHRAKTGHFIRQNPGRAYQGESNIRYGKIAGVRLK